MLPDGSQVGDAAWSYEEPLENAMAVARRVAFDPPRVQVEEVVPSGSARR